MAVSGNPFLIIGITQPYFASDEADRINTLLSNKEVNYLHIRKPDSPKEQLERLIAKIKVCHYPYIKLHDHFDLVKKYNLGGYHLNSRCDIVEKDDKPLSKSIHSLDEIKDSEGYDYFFISPVYDSISKPGYNSSFDFNKLRKAIEGKNAIALGGVTPEKFDELKGLGFYGAAMLSYFFNNKKIIK